MADLDGLKLSLAALSCIFWSLERRYFEPPKYNYNKLTSCQTGPNKPNATIFEDYIFRVQISLSLSLSLSLGVHLEAAT